MINMLYIVPEKTINPLYFVENLLCWLIIALIIIIAVFELRGYIKFFTTLFSIIIIAIHYYLVLELMRFENISLMPLLIIETTNKGAVFEPDYGQIIIYSLLYLWRKQIIILFSKIHHRFKQQR